MNNDFLRFSNQQLQNDEGVVNYCAKKEPKKKERQTSGDTALKIILDEIYSYDKTVHLSTQDSADVPKLLAPIIASGVFFLFCVLATVIAYFSAEFFTLPIVMVTYSAFVPISLLYFFYRLSASKKLKFSTIMISVVLGSLVYTTVELIFSNAVDETMHDYHSFVAGRCLLELFLVYVLSFSLIKSCKAENMATSLLIACSVASGYSIARALSENFYTLLINVEVENGANTVGAIINLKNFIQTSVVSLLKSFSITSIFKPCIFICLSIVSMSVLRADFKSTVTAVFTFLFCVTTYVLTSIQTPFNVLTVLYNLISVVFTLYLFINTVNACLK